MQRAVQHLLAYITMAAVKSSRASLIQSQVGGGQTGARVSGLVGSWVSGLVGVMFL